MMRLNGYRLLGARVIYPARYGPIENFSMDFRLPSHLRSRDLS